MIPAPRTFYKSLLIKLKMKKEAIVVLIFVFLVAQVSAEISCSDNSQVIWDQKEINIGFSKIINGIGIGIAKTEERAFYKRVIAELIIDARRIDLSNKTSSQDIEIITGKYNVGFTETSDEKAKIKVNGESKEIEEGSIETIKDLAVMLIESKNILDQEAIVVKLIAGYKQISLSNDLHPSEKITFGNTTYFIELSSASSSNAIIKVSYCKTGEIIEITETIEIINKTEDKTNTTSNVTSANKTADNQKNDSSKQVSVAEVRERLRKLNETQSNGDTSQQKIGFFRRIISWFKKLFGLN